MTELITGAAIKAALPCLWQPGITPQECAKDGACDNCAMALRIPDDAVLHPGPCLPITEEGTERLARALCETFDLGHDHEHYTPRICPDGPEDATAIIAALRADR